MTLCLYNFTEYKISSYIYADDKRTEKSLKYSILMELIRTSLHNVFYITKIF